MGYFEPLALGGIFEGCPTGLGGCLPLFGRFGLLGGTGCLCEVPWGLGALIGFLGGGTGGL